MFTQHLGDRFMPLVERDAAALLPEDVAAWLLAVLHHAHWGVDLFFVLSGFSLAQGYVRAFAGGSSATRARTFYMRRAARILPAYYVALAVVLVAHRAVVHDASFGAALAVHLVVLQGYFTPGGLIFIGATWSLTTEIGFYLVLPAIARPLLGRSRWAWGFGAALCVLAWASRAALHDWTLDHGAHTALLEATQRRWVTSRLDQFVLGALAARAYAASADSAWAMRLARVAPLGVVVAVAALVVGFRLEGALYLEPGGSWPYALVSVATAALVLAAASCKGAALRVVAPTPLCAIGVVSYGVFLYHQLALGFVGWLLPGEGWAVLAKNAATALLASVAMGAASWVVIERPLLQRFARTNRRKES